MASPSLRDFLETLPPEEWFRVSQPVDPDHFATALAVELERRGRHPVIKVERPQGFDMPIVCNVFGDPQRAAGSVGTTPEGFARRWLDAEQRPVAPVVVADGPVHEVVHVGAGVDVMRIPAVRHFAADAGRYLPSGVQVAKDPDTGVRNLSYARMQLKGRDRMAVSLHSRAHLWDYQRRAEERGEPLELAVVVGPHPAVYLAAGCKLGIEVDEYDLAGGLLGQPVELVRCVSIDAEVPANAELVVEGRILPGAREDEGPFGEYTGYSTSRSTRNAFEVTAITHRRDAMFVDIVPGASAEHLFLCRVSKEAHVLNSLRAAVPTVRALHIPQSGTLYHAYLSMQQTAQGQARQALMLLFGLDPYVKLAVAVDEDVDVFDEREVWWAVATRVQAERDVFVVPRVFCNRLDPSAVGGMSSKMAIDATRGEGWDAIVCSLPADVTESVRRLVG